MIMQNAGDRRRALIKNDCRDCGYTINRGDIMSEQNKMKNTKNKKKSDGRFKSKHINHDPQSESSRAKFGLQNETSNADITANHKGQ